MNLVFLSAAGALLATILVGLAQVFRQPGRADSLLAVLLFGTTGVALVLLMGSELRTSHWCLRCSVLCWR